ncbi:phosphoadenylyl-sulfate reductase [Tsuneonella amylolytica]|uniref:phosphoadenylyl-sulfate reductase n=1 Tax=Tsuneonella amylolytica TaxID=2338327 RepID=UPI000EA9193F|nr:phosphoadenylyl-sulfate reductase [Tsuneonella amylolytica]
MRPERIPVEEPRDLETEALAFLSQAIRRDHRGRIAMVSSFGAESVVLLDLVARINRATPVLFNETGMLFSETIAYQREVAEALGLTNVQVVRPTALQLAAYDGDGTLSTRDTDACCNLRKREPLQRALAPFGAWINGRKRFQNAERARLEMSEIDEAGRVKLNPLADWTSADIAEYMDRRNLPRHPLVAQGYPSIGCAPCTSKVAPGEDPRAGRWRDSEKTECGIHYVEGQFVQGGGI